LFWSPSWISAIFQYGGHAQFLNFQNFLFFKSTILQYGRQGAILKYNLTFYNVAAIFKI